MIVETMTYEEVVKELSSDMTKIVNDNSRVFRELRKQIQKDYDCGIKNYFYTSQFKNITLVFKLSEQYSCFPFSYTIVHLKNETYYLIYMNLGCYNNPIKGGFYFISYHAYNRYLERYYKDNKQNIFNKEELLFKMIEKGSNNIIHQNRGENYKDNIYNFTSDGILLGRQKDYNVHYNLYIYDTFLTYKMMYKEQKQLFKEDFLPNFAFTIAYNIFHNYDNQNLYSSKVYKIMDFSMMINKLDLNFSKISEMVYDQWINKIAKGYCEDIGIPSSQEKFVSDTIKSLLVSNRFNVVNNIKKILKDPSSLGEKSKEKHFIEFADYESILDMVHSYFSDIAKNLNLV